MKILQVLQSFSPKFGGTVNVMYNLSKGLSKLGHDVTIITTDYGFDEKYAASIEKEGVKVIKFKCIFNFASFLYSPSMKKWLKENLRNFDIVHMHDFRTYQQNILLKYTKEVGVPYIVQAHGSTPRIMEKQWLKKIYDHVWGTKILKDSSKLIAVSDIEIKQYKDMGIKEEKISIIPNGIEPKKLTNELKRGEFRRKHDINKKYMILFLGRIHKRKGIGILVNSFNRLLNEINNCNLVIVGPDDGYKEELIKLVDSLNINDYVKFIDYTKNVSEAYFDANILVYPATYEIFGLVPFEAILYGTPVIVTDDCGCGKLVNEANCGYSVTYGDVDELKNKMKYVIQNPAESKKMVERGNEYISHFLTWDKISKDVEEIYNQVISRDYPKKRL